jgi:pimeloyl-ACP methyl ester carboxylesterase
MAARISVSNDGIRIAYDVTGQGPALMLLHGAGKTRRDWGKLGYVDRLKSDFTVITVDTRGTGDSDILVDIADYAIEKLCDDLCRIADACGANRFLVWGYSFGGNIARYLAAWTDRVIALAAIGVPFGPAVDRDFDQFITEFVHKWQPVADAYKAGGMTEQERKSAIKGRIPVWVACFQAMRAWPAIMPGDLHCPTLLVMGTKNTSALKWVQANRDVLEHSAVQVEIIDGLNHSQEFTTIDRVFPVVLNFFKHCDLGSPTI